MLLLTSTLCVCFLTFDSFYPPVTDKRLTIFFKSPSGYLPDKALLSRSDIAPAAHKILEEERRNYKIIFWLSTLNLACIPGLLTIHPEREK
jgi:hypothetical protein